MGDSTESEPQKESGNREEVLGWDEEGVNQEKPCQKVDEQKELLVEHSSKALVASPDFPLSDRGGSITAEPVVASDTHPVHHDQSKGDGRDIRKAYIHDDVVPPAFSEVRQDVLHA